jgi:peptidoglycan hydrolase FlgJ
MMAPTGLPPRLVSFGRFDLRAAPPAMRRAAEEFEAVFVGQLLSGMAEGLASDGPAGGGALGGGDDDPFASMLRDEYGKLISRSGGIGVADAVLREMLRLQEGR